MAERQPFRLDEGGLIDRDRPLKFRFEGRSFSGFDGDSLASALLANGVKTIGRSFKYHRPRGVFTAGEEEPCALVELGSGNARVPSARATTVPLQDGLEARGQFGWPSINFDLGRVLDYTHRLWIAGFYNKTFKWPDWHAWEGLIRRSSGIGRPLAGPDPDRYERMNWHCDVLVCGGGPAGLMAALVTARSGLRVLLAEQDERLGGSLLRERIDLDGRPGVDWVADVRHELEALPNVLLLPRTTATGIYDHRVTTLLQRGQGSGWRECHWTVRPRHILVATGAIEQGLIFPNNDRPGIMLAGAARSYLNRFAVLGGKRVIIATNNDSAYQTAVDYARAGITVEAVVDERPEVPASLTRDMEALGAVPFSGARITNTRGDRALSRVCVQSAQRRETWHECDLLAVSGGWAPRIHLLAHAGVKNRFDPDCRAFVPVALPTDFSVAGAVTGKADVAETLRQAAHSATRVCTALGVAAAEAQPPEVTECPRYGCRGLWQAPRPSRRRQWIDLAHDVTVTDSEIAVREGFVSVEHFKRYTTAGMSIDQGKTSNTNVFLLLSALTGKDPSQTGTTTFRPPYTPVTIGAIAAQNTGECLAPRRYLPAHVQHESLGARFEDYGWQRPEAYPHPGESVDAAVRREALAVRQGVGVFDNSPIGKLEVRGPDAAIFLDRLYINDLLGLKQGKARYGLMLNENGVIIDDGVVLRLSEDHFMVHTTSGGVHRIHEWMEEWLQCEWRDLAVVVHNATSQFANFTVAGPRARDTLAALGCDATLGLETLEHMSFSVGNLSGIGMRLTRVSYSGELSFEINLPARYGCDMLRAIMEAGARHGIVPFGVEALMALRTEKGYLHVGTDTDGTTTPDDVGWGQIARKKNRDFIGRRSLFRPGNMENGRLQFVGLRCNQPGQALIAGEHLLMGQGRQPPAITDGWITSACFSPSLERYIALAMLRNGRGHDGATVTVCGARNRYTAEVAPPTHFDPENRRLT